MSFSTVSEAARSYTAPWPPTKKIALNSSTLTLSSTTLLLSLATAASSLRNATTSSGGDFSLLGSTGGLPPLGDAMVTWAPALVNSM